MSELEATIKIKEDSKDKIGTIGFGDDIRKLVDRLVKDNVEPKFEISRVNRETMVRLYSDMYSIRSNYDYQVSDIEYDISNIPDEDLKLLKVKSGDTVKSLYEMLTLFRLTDETSLSDIHIDNISDKYSYISYSRSTRGGTPRETIQILSKKYDR